jgi:hypothetical protein
MKMKQRSKQKTISLPTRNEWIPWYDPGPSGNRNELNLSPANPPATSETHSTTTRNALSTTTEGDKKKEIKKIKTKNNQPNKQTNGKRESDKKK